MEIHENIIITPVRISKGHPIFRAFRFRNFSFFFFGQTISLIGTWSQSLAISWLVWRLTRSAMWLGIVGVTTQFPMLILGLLGGVFADRFDRLRTFTLMQILCMIQAIALSFLTMSGVIHLWHVVILSAMLGAIYSFEFPVRQAFVADMVGREDLLNAVSLNAALLHATRMLGPVAAGIVVAWKGEGICFLFNAATFIFLIAALMFIDRSKLHHARVPDGSIIDSVGEIIKFIRSHGDTKLALYLVATCSVVGMAYIYLLPVFADRIFGGGAAHLGWLMGASGLGALVGALSLASRRSQKDLLKLGGIFAALFSVGLIGFSFTRVIWVAIPIMTMMGFFLTIVFSISNTYLQNSTPDHLRGRIMSFFTTIFMGIGPFGGLAAGLIAESHGVAGTVTGFGVVCLVLSIIIVLKTRRGVKCGSGIVDRGS